MEVKASRLTKPYMWAVIVLGAAAFACAMARLPWARLDQRFLILGLITVGIGSRLSVRVPRVRGQITVSDTFVFLTLLLFDGEAAILLATVEAVFTSVRATRKKFHHLFNAAGMGLTHFLTVWGVRLF